NRGGLAGPTDGVGHELREVVLARLLGGLVQIAHGTAPFRGIERSSTDLEGIPCGDRVRTVPRPVASGSGDPGDQLYLRTVRQVSLGIVLRKRNSLCPAHLRHQVREGIFCPTVWRRLHY